VVVKKTPPTKVTPAANEIDIQIANLRKKTVRSIPSKNDFTAKLKEV
jgi:hypothetical protein